MTMWIFHLLLLLMFMATGFSWVIKTNVDGISPGETKDFQLECTQEKQTVFKNVYGIIIRKTEDNSILAKIDIQQNNAQKISTNNYLKVSGSVRSGRVAFLKLTWSQVSQDDLGTYECEVSGFSHQNVFKTISVPSRSIKKAKIYTQKEVNEIRQNLQSQVNVLKYALALCQGTGTGHRTTLNPTWTWTTMLPPSTRIPTTKPAIKTTQKPTWTWTTMLPPSTRIHTTKPAIKTTQKPTWTWTTMLPPSTRIHTTKPAIKTTQKPTWTWTTMLPPSTRIHTTKPAIKTTQKPTSAITTLSPNTGTPKSGATAWPRGFYWLPKPKTGCPNVHASSTGSQVKTVDPSAPELRFQLNFENRKFEQCEMSIKSNNGSSLTDHLADNSWPEGNYCIGTDRTCRFYFRTGSIEYMYRDSTSCANPTNVNRVFYLHLCCKESGSASTPIKLPTDMPFYLYRHKSECQQVEGMDVRAVKASYSWNKCTRFISKTGKGSRRYRSDVYLCHYQRSAANNGK